MTPILIQAIDIALRLLSHRIFSFLCLFLTAGAFAWVLYQPDVLRIISSSIFGLLCLLYQRKDSEPQQEKQND